ncbi:MAG: hypothetical protein QOI57_1317 [Rubrobacteraceae bacterium]|jgi:hypothetical protein|nr:hypothetical protein [Rubrobacteraceae bacterium]
MDDRPQDKAEERRRRGPLGDEGDADETRRVPQGGSGGSRGGDDAETGQIPLEGTEREGATSPGGATPSRRASRESREEDPDTRVIRTPGTSEDDVMPYTREERLRDVYGGVDWLASFIGCVFALVCASVLLLLFSGLVLGPLGFTLDIAGREMDTAMIIGFAVVGVTLLLSYFIGGYVAGRLVRFDGGRNGAATVVWSILLGVIFVFFGAVLLGSFLPGTIFGTVQGFLQGTVLPSIGGLIQAGLVGAGIALGALVLMLLGGFLGGRFGNRYHTQIDETT